MRSRRCCCSRFSSARRKARWRSAVVAFLFALHPLHVESVAWIAERKDVLSALFWFLTLWFVRALYGASGRNRYALALGAFCLGLLAKPMAVTLPFVLLLLDFWPLRRGSKAAAEVVWEKAPFFAVAAVVAVITYLVQRASGAVQAVSAFRLLACGERAGQLRRVYRQDVLASGSGGVLSISAGRACVAGGLGAAIAIAGIYGSRFTARFAITPIWLWDGFGIWGRWYR